MERRNPGSPLAHHRRQLPVNTVLGWTAQFRIFWLWIEAICRILHPKAIALQRLTKFMISTSSPIALTTILSPPTPLDLRIASHMSSHRVIRTAPQLDKPFLYHLDL